MKVYSKAMYGRGTIFVTPGKDHPETSDWLKESQDDEGRTVRSPIQYTVTFARGEAEVEDQLGEYMIAKRLATSYPQRIILPASEQIQLGPKYATPILVGRPLAGNGMPA